MSRRAPLRSGFRFSAMAFTLLLVPSKLWADGTVEINLNDRGQEVADELQIDIEALETQLGERVGEAFDVLRLSDYLESFANAAAFSNRGIGVDYASGKSHFQLGIAGNISASLGDKGLGEIEADRPVAGLAPNISIMAGWQLSEFDLPELTVYANGFHRSATDEEGELEAAITSAGVHGQWRLFRPKRNFRVRELLFAWGGLDITGGIEYSRWSLALNREIETELPLGEGSSSLDVLMTSEGRYELSASALTLPIEVSTSVRLFYIAWLYGGAGLDMQLGKASINADLTGSLTNAEPINGETFELGTARVQLEESAGPSVGRVRFLAGLQLDLWHVKTFVQANVMPDRAASIALGVRGDI